MDRILAPNKSQKEQPMYKLSNSHGLVTGGAQYNVF